MLMAMRSTVKKFCERLYKELNREDWGNIDPELFSEIAGGDMSADAEALMKILEHVL